MSIKIGDEFRLTSGLRVVVSDEAQPGQTRGWWVHEDSTIGDDRNYYTLPSCVEAMWDFDSSQYRDPAALVAAGYLLLCPLPAGAEAADIGKTLESILIKPPGAMPPNPKQAYGDLKAKVQLVPPALTLGAARALEEGAVKYGPYNWRDIKVESLTYVGAILRHTFAYMDGEDLDPESTVGKTHLEGIAGCIAILLDATNGNFLIDNRPPAGPAPKMVLTPAAPVSTFRFTL